MWFNVTIILSDPKSWIIDISSLAQKKNSLRSETKDTINPWGRLDHLNFRCDVCTVIVMYWVWCLWWGFQWTRSTLINIMIIMIYQFLSKSFNCKISIKPSFCKIRQQLFVVTLFLTRFAFLCQVCS